MENSSSSRHQPLRCNETLPRQSASGELPSTPLLQPREETSNTVASTRANMEMNRVSNYQELMPQFCHALKDKAILGDLRVMRNMLMLEPYYQPVQWHKINNLQDEIRIHMRRIVVDWMLDVCVDQRCHLDVFLLAANIMDRFLATMRLKKKQFQLLGACAIFLASKMLEPSPIPAITLVRYTADTYDRDELLSMELLILSKLQWDLTAITAYDYIDHILESINQKWRNSQAGNSSGSNFIDPRNYETLRRQTEELLTKCTVDPAFMSLPASWLASASLASAVQQDFESGHPPTAEVSVSLKEIVSEIRKVTRVEMECLRQCIEQIEELFISSSSSDQQKSPKSSISATSSSAASADDSGYFFSSPEKNKGEILTELAEERRTQRLAEIVTYRRPSSGLEENPHQQPQQESIDFASESNNSKRKEGRKGSESNNSTPTEVFRVVAFCVT